jgi:hypothetical protein
MAPPRTGPGSHASDHPGSQPNVRFGVRRVAFVMSAVCPVYPKQQTFPDPLGTSHLCHKQTSARAQWHRLFGWHRPGDGSSAIDEDLRDRTQRPILQPHDRNWLGLNWKFNRQNFERPILPAQTHNRTG